MDSYLFSILILAVGLLAGYGLGEDGQKVFSNQSLTKISREAIERSFCGGKILTATWVQVNPGDKENKLLYACSEQKKQ